MKFNLILERFTKKYMNSITSIQNPKIKFLNLLKEKSRIRKKEGVFIIEGQREINLAIIGGYQIKQIYFCPSIIEENELRNTIPDLENGTELYKISDHIYEKIAYRTSTEGIIAVAETKEQALHDLFLLLKKNR